jgi:predicted O-methyltransferase YrrM
MNCIFVCVFNQEKYVDMFFLLLESIFIYGNLDYNTNILVYTSTSFMNKIKKSHLFNDEKIKFEINDTYNNIDKACKARLDLFNLHSIKNYNNILYLDTDILVKDDINKVFDVCKEDILYVLEEGEIHSDSDFWGKTLFGNEVNNYDDKSAFTSGILLFNNCEKIKDLFNKINEDIIKSPYYFACYDQPYIVYNAFKYNLYNNKILKSLVVNNDINIHSDKVIHHFPGGPGVYQHKIDAMIIFLNNLKDYYKLFIEQILSNGFTLVSKERLTNLYNQCLKFKNTNYSFVECGVAKGGSLAMMKFSCGKNNKVFGLDSFEGMPPITNEEIVDIIDYNKSCPLTNFGKVGDNLSGGIDNVYNTFNKLSLNMDNVILIKGFFQDTLQIQENIDNIGDIAILRLDGDCYESTKICLEKLYDNVIDGGIIIIDNYCHFIGAKKATDEFRIKHKILTPLIQTDYTEYYWVKYSNIENIFTLNIDDDIWTCSDKMRYDIYDFFKDKSHFKIAEIGSHKGYSTKILSKIFSKVYAVDNSVEWTEFNKKFNKDATNIEYVILDIYKDSWEILPNDIEISFIDAGHSYECCKSDILNSIKQFKNLQYIIFDDYGVWSGVKQIIDEMIENKILNFEKFIGLNDVPSPNGIVKNVNEGVICSIKIVNKIINKTYTWENSQIKFLDNYKMDAFGEGNYKIIDKQNIIANFGGREHSIKFNIDYTEFSSTRIDDLQIVNGKLINYTL